ncbi:unnamed protein product [Sphagnum jensenii]|uniref:tRNA (guanine(37)-N1)-methyltransferase n=1 Tax=Sphagnum jensenii TaxID=128206 RepID=A0ABP1AMG7_9BRYO
MNMIATPCMVGITSNHICFKNQKTMVHNLGLFSSLWSNPGISKQRILLWKCVSTLHVSNFFSGTGEDKSSEEINQSIGLQKPCAQLHQRIPFYGPSLERGQIPECKPKYPQQPLESTCLNLSPISQQVQEASATTYLKGADIDRESFTRVFTLAALRVPLAECETLVGMLKGHLLNWPRVKNVARVDGDNGDAELKKLLWVENDCSTPESLIDSVRSAVFVDDSTIYSTAVSQKSVRKRKFPNLAKLVFGSSKGPYRLSQPSWKDNLQEGNLVRGSSRKAWEEGAVSVEIVEDSGAENDEEGDAERWREPTRLLLLDEKYLDKPNEELPQSVQVVLGKRQCELVKCRLSLAYDYWPTDELLKEILPDGMTVPTAYESVGHIAHLNLREEHLPFRHIIAQVVLDKNKPRIRTVVNKTDAIHSKYRTMQLELLAGNSSLVTTVVEHGLSFRLDLASVYWNSRLATERQRLITSFDPNDIVCDVFAGVGPIAVTAAKKVKYVYANDLNPSAIAYLHRNLVANRLTHKVDIFNKDGREFVRGLLEGIRPICFTQVVMNLPLDAVEFLDVFVGAFSRDFWETRTLPKIHVYGFSKATDPELDYSKRIGDILGEVPHPLFIHRVRLVAPGKWMLCASFRLPAQIALSKTLKLGVLTQGDGT